MRREIIGRDFHPSGVGFRPSASRQGGDGGRELRAVLRWLKCCTEMTFR